VADPFANGENRRGARRQELTADSRKESSMDGFPADVLSRWIHVGTAIVLVGGTCFMRFVLLPSARATLSDEAHASLREAVRNRWKRFVHLGIALLLISGFYNYIKAMPGHKGVPLYHALIGTKILLALAVFFLGSALVGRSPAFAKMREYPRPWLMLILLLSAAIVGISGYCKVVLPSKAAPTVIMTYEAGS
jgi:uncharacterized membrane protein